MGTVATKMNIAVCKDYRIIIVGSSHDVAANVLDCDVQTPIMLLHSLLD